MSSALELKDLGNEAYKAKQYDVALDLYERGIVLDPQNVDLLNNASAAKFAMQCYNEAKAYAVRSINARENFKAYKRLGDSQWKLGELQEAITAYERALAMEPNDSLCEENLRALKACLQERGRQRYNGSTPTVTLPVLPVGKLALFLNSAVVCLAALLVLLVPLAPSHTRGPWRLILCFAAASNAIVVHPMGLLKFDVAVLRKWPRNRYTLQLAMCSFMLLLDASPQLVLLFVMGIYSALVLSANTNVISELAPTLWRLVAPVMHNISSNAQGLVLYAATMEAIAFFTVFFSGNIVLSIVFMQYIKMLYQLDNNLRLAFHGVRLNLTHLARMRYVPPFVDAALQKIADTLYLLSQ
ncbi:putative Tetratricopeptide repeat [Trypanosoma vivax]|nr:putative Tetratricopeptide repeat [Trypanosoma vivax]